MIIVKANSNTITGTLHSYEVEGDDLLVKLVLSQDQHVECRFPKVPASIITLIRKLDNAKLSTATINLNTGMVDLGQTLNIDPSTVAAGKKLREQKNRERAIGGGGNLVG